MIRSVTMTQTKERSLIDNSSTSLPRAACFSVTMQISSRGLYVYRSDDGLRSRFRYFERTSTAFNSF